MHSYVSKTASGFSLPLISLRYVEPNQPVKGNVRRIVIAMIVFPNSH